jgi:OmpA family
VICRHSRSDEDCCCAALRQTHHRPKRRVLVPAREILALSEKRAASVRQVLLDRFQVDAVRLEFKGLGDTKPAAKNDTAEGRQNNRRVELVRL